MHPHVRKLLELQKVDQETLSLTRDINSLPVEEVRRRKRLDELERIANACRERLTKTQLDTRALERAAKSCTDEIEKLNLRLGTVRNNAEYQAMLFQIETLQKDRRETEEECLRLLENIEPQQAELTVAEAAAAAEREVLEGFLTEADELRTSRAGAIAEVNARRAALAHGIPEDLLQRYEGLFKTRDAMAVCAVADNFCQGCYNKVTMNDIARLMGKTSVVACGSCQRILHLGE